MKLNIPWEWYRTFLAVMKEGSLSGAARRLAITQPTAGRHIAALESALGLVLFTMPDFFAFHLDTWLVMHEDLRHSQACKTVFDFLAEGLQAYINREKR